MFRDRKECTATFHENSKHRESTAEFYRLLNEFTRDRLGGPHSAQCALYSVDFAEIGELQVQDRWERAGEILADAALTR